MSPSLSLSLSLLSSDQIFLKLKQIILPKITESQCPGYVAEDPKHYDLTEYFPNSTESAVCGMVSRDVYKRQELF